MHEPLSPMMEDSESNLPKIGSPNFFQRNCRSMSEGSLRLMIINLILCGVIGNFFWYPVVFRTFGLIPGFFVITLCVAFNYLLCYFIFLASNEANCNSYMGLIEVYLSPKWRNIARFTYLLDYFSAFVIGLLLCWNISAYLMYYWGVLDDSAIEDMDKLTFKSYEPRIIVLRFAVVGIGFLISMPWYLNTKMNNFKPILIGFLIVMILNIGYLIIDLGEFRSYYQSQGTWEISYVKPITLDSFRYIFIFLCSYYIESNLLTMKIDTHNATMARVTKAIKISHIFFLFFASVFGSYGYLCLGDRFTSDLFMLRKSFPGKHHETIYRILLVFVALLYIHYMPYFIISFRNFFYSNFKYQPSFSVISIVPLTIAAMISFGYPKIVNFLGYSAILVCLMNAFLFPILIVKQTEAIRHKHWTIHRSLDATCVVLVCIALASFVALVRNDLGYN
jgi:amino acid permease